MLEYHFAICQEKNRTESFAFRSFAGLWGSICPQLIVEHKSLVICSGNVPMYSRIFPRFVLFVWVYLVRFWFKLSPRRPLCSRVGEFCVLLFLTDTLILWLSNIVFKGTRTYRLSFPHPHPHLLTMAKILTVYWLRSACWLARINRGKEEPNTTISRHTRG